MMNTQTFDERLRRAQLLLAEIHHVSVATVNQDGSPHNSPVLMAFDNQLCGFWTSHPDSLHSQNIARTGQVFLVVFDSREGRGGLFIEGAAAALDNKTDFDPGYQTYKKLKESTGGTLAAKEHYLGPGPQRLYRMVPRKFWINSSDRNPRGFVIRDYRVEISINQLFGEEGSK